VTVIWLDGQWHDEHTATISVFDHGLLYGDGVFEGMRAYGGRVFRMDQHLDRLYDSARAVWMDIPMSKAELGAITLEAVKRAALDDAYLRHIVTRGRGDLGLDPRKCKQPTMLLIVDRIRLWPEETYAKGLKVITAGTPMPHREALSPRVKSLNYLSHILAKVEAIQAGADEAIMLDPAGYVTEGSGQNLFLVKRGVMRTPPAWAGILRGVTRDAVMELATEAGLTVQEEPLNRYDIYTADEGFFTGTASEIAPIRELDGRQIGEGRMGPVTADLRKRFRQLVRG
jgi:branched-chain amino acid aminotransferase